MPTYRSLTISLTSQFDMLTIPEYAPPSVPPDPFTDFPVLVDESTASINVYIPTYPCSQFWLSYKIAAPHPHGILYYFKLFIYGKCVISWGCGKEDGYKGHTMFGLFTAPGGRGVEKRVLAYGSTSEGERMPEMLGDFMEVKVYRSKGRKRVMPELKEYQAPNTSRSPRQSKKTDSGSKKVASYGSGIDLINAGFLKKEHPQRYFKYHLLDPLDEPFSTFRYYYRTWDQLQELGVVSSPASNFDSSPIHSKDVAIWARGMDEMTSSAEELVNITESPTVSHESSLQAEPSLHISPMPDFDTTGKLLAPEDSLNNFNPRSGMYEYRSMSPPQTSSRDQQETSSLPSNIIPNNISVISLNTYQISSPSSQPTKSTLTHKTSKENFASLIRNQTPAPSSNNFKLTDLSATIEKTSSRRSSSPLPWRWRKDQGRKSLNALRNVFSFDNPKQRQHKTADTNVASNSEIVKNLHSGENSSNHSDHSVNDANEAVIFGLEDNGPES